MRQQPFGDEHRTLDALVGLRGEQGADLVVVQQLDGSLGAAVRAGDEQHRFAAVARLSDLGNPVGNAAAELLRRLRGDVYAAGVPP